MIVKLIAVCIGAYGLGCFHFEANRPKAIGTAIAFIGLAIVAWWKLA